MSSSATAVSSTQQPAPGQPPNALMPKKKDPRLRELQKAQTDKRFFDSADYEVSKAHTPSNRKGDLLTAARNAPHAGINDGRPDDTKQQ